ncbi:MAG: hypothetical protein ABIP27_10520 [Flavobacterium circumlabens]|uniref:Uncharacterized protein n=1 Tax=Flavobacterium circumlabens TaxID=2133765 RepID=A0A4Y7U9M7_9FLAO|nr:hypothetical protein [Flavobacterium circumlabens]TCN53883.1 hypothetical protein EV142_108189 [Flavobacterium circumlabens]TEB42529.1 hypothetical protein D0809_19380 [Flavobacterium circumlabens]
MQEKENKRKQNIRLLIAIAIALILVVLSQFYFYQGTNALDSEITELVAKYNKNCPLIIQEGIRLDSVSLPDNKAAQYNLTLLHVEKKTADISLIQKEIEKSLVSTAKANPGLQAFRDNDFALFYSYSDQNKVFLFKITIAPDQYK